MDRMKDPNSFDEKDLIFAMGVRFWSNLVLTEDISDVKKCLEVLDNLNIIIESRDTYELFSSATKENSKIENETNLIIYEDPQISHVSLENEKSLCSIFFLHQDLFSKI